MPSLVTGTCSRCSLAMRYPSAVGPACSAARGITVNAMVCTLKGCIVASWVGDEGSSESRRLGTSAEWAYKSVKLTQRSLLPILHSTHLKTSIMHFSLTSLASAALLLASLGSALPTYETSSALISRDAGPSGAVVTPVGDTAYKVGDVIALKYQRVMQTGYAVTSALNVTLRTFDGKVTYNAVRAHLANIFLSLLPPPTDDVQPASPAWSFAELTFFLSHPPTERHQREFSPASDEIATFS
jgi:hypothetical protein